MKFLPLFFLAASAFPAASEVVSVIETGSPWFYWDKTPPPPGAWKNVVYVETGWGTGNSSLGYSTSSPADPPDGTNIGYGGNAASKYMTAYFRREFTVPTAPGNPYTNVTIGLAADDGAVVYINGVELYRENMPTGVIGPTTAAISGVDGKAETALRERVFPISVLNLSGTNAITVEVHQNTASSSDLHFNLYLNVSDAPACYGEAFPGIVADMTDTVQNTDPDENDPTRLHLGYLRDIPGEEGLQFDAACIKLNTGTPGGEILTTNLSRPNLLELPSDVVRVDMNTRMELLTEPIDTRNFTDIKASVDVLCWKDPSASWNGVSDFLKASILTSSDGINYTETPWFDYKGVGTSSSTGDTLLAENAANKWRVPTSAADDANDAGGKNWKQLGYVLPASWKDGAGAKGYENEAGGPYIPYLATNSAATIAAMKTEMLTNQKPSIYIRMPFSMAVPSTTYTSLELHLRWEDGYVAYLNGTEVARGNSPAAPNYASLATTIRADTDAVKYQIINITAFKHLLVQGANANVLAIHGMNSPATSSDMLIQAKIIANKPGPVDPTTLSALGASETGPFVHLSSGTKIPDGTRAVKVKFSADLTGDPNGPGGLNKAYFLDNIRFTGTAIAPNNFGTFMSAQLAGQPEASMTPNADGDADSILNLLEYGFVSDAGISNQTTPQGGSVLPIMTRMPNGTLRLTFRMIADAAEAGITFANAGYMNIRDLRYEPQISPDLDNWSSILEWNDISITDNDDGTLTAIVETANPVQSSNAKFFSRVKVYLLRSSWLSDENDACPL
ncbi:MAG: hypothetical protein KA004_02260 [Verrucomicrobiales bacterium]|nr:hypothetical protein [Verrucomicrobiales bacterium]